jgi:hypothetical protein
MARAHQSQPIQNRRSTTLTALSGFVRAGLLAAPLLASGTASSQQPSSPEAWSAPQGAPAGTIAFFLVDPASSGSGLLGRGTFTYKGQSYSFEATGTRLSRTSADTPPSLSGAIYNVNSLSDLNGQYISVGDRAAGLHFIRNEKGVVAELGTGVGSGKLQYREQSDPITITLVGPAP